MKMKYEKPLVVVDRYELSQTIAGCGIKVNYLESTCFLFDPDVPAKTKAFAANGYFMEIGLTGCFETVIEGMDYDGVCYHTQVNAVLLS